MYELWLLCKADGIECDLFSNHAPLGQTTLRVGREKVEARVIVSVTVCVVLLCCVG